MFFNGDVVLWGFYIEVELGFWVVRDWNDVVVNLCRFVVKYGDYFVGLVC